MRIAILTILAAVTALGQQPPNTLTQKEIEEGWILLFDGDSLFGWQPQGAAEWMVENGAITTKPGPYGWLRSGSQFADYRLQLEFRACENCNSGVFLRSATKGEPHVTGYELQIWTGNAKFPTGSLVNHAAAKTKFKGDVWNQYDVTLQGEVLFYSIGCAFCQANLSDLQSRQEEAAAQVQERRKRYFTSSAGLLPK